jgi:hypothetical protein
MSKVQLSKVEEITRDRLNKFQVDHNIEFPEKRLRTFEETINFMIDEATETPILRSQIEKFTCTFREKTVQYENVIKRLEEEIKQLRQ